jgi:hypothetical protein
VVSYSARVTPLSGPVALDHVYVLRHGEVEVAVRFSRAR